MRLWRWVTRLLKGDALDHEKLDEAFFQAFSSPPGEQVLKFFMEEYIMNSCYNPELGSNGSLVADGRRDVVIDIIQRMDRHQNQHKYKPDDKVGEDA